MSSPSMVHRSGDTLVVRSVVSGDQLFVNEPTESNLSDDTSEDIDFSDDTLTTQAHDSTSDELKNLPECKVRRNYSCSSCVFFTQNPRYFLYHLRDVHKEKVRIYECPNCLYASKHFQKLMRHTKMLHADYDSNELMELTRVKTRRKRKKAAGPSPPPVEPEEEQIESTVEDDTDEIELPIEIISKKTELKCSLCSFTTRHQGQLTRHEKQEHIKTKFFRCSKCSYVTHIKARFTKHVKYHSMPMIKCDLCDFRTPYKWNLDRHYKNHSGSGTFKCSACNFTADIKQSLTVHEMNHHVPPVGQAAGLGVGRRRNKVGASDTTAAEDAAAAAVVTPNESQHFNNNNNVQLTDNKKVGGEPNESPIVNPTRKSPKIKISLKKVKSTSTQEQNERHNFETDFIHPDDIIHHSNGNIYIKNKCKLCNFKTAWETEMIKHERKVHNIQYDQQQKPTKVGQVVKKAMRPIPNLIPIDKVKSPPRGDEISQKDLNEMCAKSTNSSLRDFTSLFDEDLGPGVEDKQKLDSTSVFKKKNASFFDKLKEKLMTDAGETCNLTCKWCGHESKCLSESAGHQKTCGKQQQQQQSHNSSTVPHFLTNPTINSSTRCQYCRQRCKSSIDLHNHLQSCSEANKTICYELSKPVANYDERSNTEIEMKLNKNLNDKNNYFEKFKEQFDAKQQSNMEQFKASLEAKQALLQQPPLSDIEKQALFMQNYQLNFVANKTKNNHVNTINNPQKATNSFFDYHSGKKPKNSININPLIFDRTKSYIEPRTKITLDANNKIRFEQVHSDFYKKHTAPYEHEKPDITIKLEEEHMQEPHPMENVVFVWNNIGQNDTGENYEDNNSLDLTMRVETPESDLCYPDHDGNNQENLNQCPQKMPTHGNDIEQVTEGRRVFKCPHCSFWATTASRFHVHIVGHLNKKPFECSLCAYRSNWRWDITKHIRLKSVRDPEHEQARVLMTDETGRRNYSKYNKYLTQLKSNEAPESQSQSDRRQKNYEEKTELPKLTRAPTMNDYENLPKNNTLRPPPPLKAAGDLIFQNFSEQRKRTSSEMKKTLFKCKKCNFRDSSRENIMQHVKGHYKADYTPQDSIVNNSSTVNSSEASSELERHCRLKHSGDVRVILASKNGTSEQIEIEDQSDEPDVHIEMSQSGALKCQQCPFSCNFQPEFDAHTDLHNPQPNNTQKCYFCPFYVREKFEMFDHLKVHGVSNPEEYINRTMLDGKELVNPDNNLTLKRYKCTYCPYVSNSKSQFLYHKQFHRHRGGQFKCDICSYNVTKRHLLHQHLKIHGVQMPGQKVKEEPETDPEPEFDIEEISTMVELDKEQIFIDIPLVWVSRDGKFSKMYKCRFCPHINLRKVNIQEHEKMHTLRNPNSPKSSEEHHCMECSYICNNAGVLSSHLKVHQSCYGQIHCLVDVNKTDEEQISELTSLLNMSSSSKEIVDNDIEDAETEELEDCMKFSAVDSTEPKQIYFCEDCPARFLHPKESTIHKRFHGIRLFYKCEYCTYTARQKPHLLSHFKVHYDDYQEKTKKLLQEFPTSKNHPAPKLCPITNAPGTNESVWVVITDKTKLPDPGKTNKISNKNFACQKCPARFFKNDLLQYHMTLHGCSNPYKCKYCDYAARTSSNLQKHVRIHLPVTSTPKLVNNVPLSGTDLFQQKSEANRKCAANEAPPKDIDPQFGTLMNGNPDFIYPTYLRNGRMKEKKYKCHKCPSAFEKREQYKVHLSLHGSKQRYKCEYCDYSVKYYANYIQHIRKHKANSMSELKKNGGDEIWVETENLDQSPFCKLAIKTINSASSSTRGPLKLSMADKQTLMILQQRRSSTSSSTKEIEEKKIFWCPHCPYTSHRRDSVDNHINRHICVTGIENNYTCEHCDYTVPQTHFLRDHVKIHFSGQRNYTPEGYMVCSNLTLSAIKLNDDNKTNENSIELVDEENQDDSKCTSDSDEKYSEIIFQDSGNELDPEAKRFKPALDKDILDLINNNTKTTEKLFVNPESGEFIESVIITKEQSH